MEHYGLPVHVNDFYSCLETHGSPFHRYKKSKRGVTDASTTTYSYYCAQNEDEVQKPHLHDDPTKQRARMKMDRFPCKGMLSLTVKNDDLDVPIRLKIRHHEVHLHYVDISIKQDIKEVVEKMRNEPVTNVSLIRNLVFLFVSC